MKISLIVNTYNKYISLLILLNSILRQTLKDIEVIIINNSNKNNRLLTKFINKAKFNVIVINDSLPLSVLKNKAIYIASGEYIMFLSNGDYIKSESLEKMYNSACNHDVVISRGYKKFLLFRFKNNFSITKADESEYHDVNINNKLIKKSVLIDNLFMESPKWENLSNIPVILSKYKTRVIDNRIFNTKFSIKPIFLHDENLLDIIKVLEYLKPQIKAREFKNIAIMEILYRLENYFYSWNRDEEVKYKLKDYLYLIDNYWFDYEIIKIVMKKDILFRYFINHAHL